MKTKRELLTEIFIDYLNENGVDCWETEIYDDSPEHYLADEVLKDEYADMTPRDMCEYMDMDDWVIDWTIDIIESEEK